MNILYTVNSMSLLSTHIFIPKKYPDRRGSDLAKLIYNAHFVPQRFLTGLLGNWITADVVCIDGFYVLI